MHHEEDHVMSLRNKTWLLQFIEWGVKLLIVAIFSLLYQMLSSQNEILRKLDQNDMRITALESKQNVIESNMVTWDVLKRVELTLQLVLAQSGIHTKVDLTGAKK